jgi:hypothetical protein
VSGDLGYRGFRSRFHFGWEDVLYQDVATPAAGANPSYIVRTFGVRCIGARAVFTPDANAATRIISLDFLDSNGTVRLRHEPSVTFVASSGAQPFEWSTAWTVSEWNTGTAVTVPVNPCVLDIGMSIRFTAQSIQATDAWTALSLVLLTLPTGPDHDGD